jgi:hypothetical protein
LRICRTSRYTEGVLANERIATLRTAEQIQNDLEAVLKALRATDVSAERKTLLKKMRQLIAEAEKSR